MNNPHVEKIYATYYKTMSAALKDIYAEINRHIFPMLNRCSRVGTADLRVVERINA